MVAAAAAAVVAHACTACSSARSPLHAGRSRASPASRQQTRRRPQAVRRERVVVRCSADGGEEAPVKKTGAQLREEYFLAAGTGGERGLPKGAFLNDDVEDGEMVEIEWLPYGEVVHAPVGSNLLRAGVNADAFRIDNRFCLTGQGKKTIECMVIDSDEAWEQMMV
eukprot:jgi/Chlat1/100/Chrsp1S03204